MYVAHDFNDTMLNVYPNKIETVHKSLCKLRLLLLLCCCDGCGNGGQSHFIFDDVLILISSRNEPVVASDAISNFLFGIKHYIYTLNHRNPECTQCSIRKEFEIRKKRKKLGRRPLYHIPRQWTLLQNKKKLAKQIQIYCNK